MAERKGEEVCERRERAEGGGEEVVAGGVGLGGRDEDVGEESRTEAAERRRERKRGREVAEFHDLETERKRRRDFVGSFVRMWKIMMSSGSRGRRTR